MATSNQSETRRAVDDEDNLNRFMEFMSVKPPLSFTQSHARSSETSNLPNNAEAGNLPSSPSANAMNVPKTLADMAALSPKDTSLPAAAGAEKVADSSDEMEPHQLRDWMKENAPLMHDRPHNLVLLEPPLSKMLHSPQLTGLRAPPPTPETTPVREAIEHLDITHIIQEQLEKHLESKANPFTLGQSIHAPVRPSPLGRTRLSFRDETDPNSRRQKNASFQRMSFTVAQGSSEATPAKINPRSGESVSLSSPSKDNGAAAMMSAVRDWVPPHLRLSTAIKVSEADDSNAGPGLESDRVAEAPNQSLEYPNTEETLPDDAIVPVQKSKSTVALADENSLQSHSHSKFTALVEESLPVAADNKTELPPHLSATKKAPMSINTSKKPIDKTTKTEDLPIDISDSMQPTSIFPSITAFSNTSASRFGTATSVSPGLPSPAVTLTPSSMTFAAISPTTAKASSAAIRATSEREGLEGALFFGAWPKSSGRDVAPSRVRKVILTSIPSSPTASFIASIIFGGPVENILVGTSSAVVLFVHADDCAKYYEATSNGVVYKKEGNKELVIFVELAKDVDVIGGMLQEMIDKDVTRCVRAFGADEDWTIEGLRKMAERKGRRLEGIEDDMGTTGPRSITFRFCSMEDAVHFKSMLTRDEAWEQCNIQYSPDPCATATGVHFDN